MDKEQTTDWQPSHYPAISEKSVGFANRFNQQGVNQIEVVVGEDLYTVRVETEIQSSEFPIVLNCHIAGYAIRLGLDARLSELLMNEWLLPKDLTRLPGNLRTLVLEASLQPTIDYFQKQNGGSFSVESVDEQTNAVPDGGLRFSLVSAAGAVAGQGFVLTNEQAIEQLLLTLQSTLETQSAISHNRLVVSVAIEIGSAKLPLADFRKLSVGDIILLDTSAADNNTAYARMSATICFICELDGNRWIVQKRVEGNNGR